MDLDHVKSYWSRLKAHEEELKKQLEENQVDQTRFFKKAVEEGFYQHNGEWIKNESCSTCGNCIDGACWNQNSGWYLEVVNPLGSCLNGWNDKKEVV